MKKTLQSSEYILLLQAYKEWLQLLNYSTGTIQVLPGHLQEFLHYQEQNDKPFLTQLEATDASGFISHLQEQTGERTGKPFSPAHLNKYIQALNLFSRYIRETGRSDTGFILERREAVRGKPAFLTKPEIQRIYEATTDTVLGIRDRAMLAVYYGCGLRLNEGANLELKDITSDRKLLHVRKGKHYKERYVPIATKNYEELRLYVDYARPLLLQEHKTESLFIDANKGHPMHKQSLYVRIKQLVKKPG
ncbi:tyrosine-type recombinase/integrase [Paraflavitalea speifideaquila]|uniref:tyrosine-type recombinase/integrase n=1 Tax=Paraflavitalea speifideaquila TaxID=3076558 RepID=UPI0028EB2AD8|nr:tyrosine-type recombinase/integrase [Paraflavitalea speifideiaquila]